MGKSAEEEIAELRREFSDNEGQIAVERGACAEYTERAAEYKRLAYEEMKKAEPFKRRIDELQKRNMAIARRLAKLGAQNGNGN